MSLAAASAETFPCPICRKPALPDYPHRHETPPRPDYDPMPAKPRDPRQLVALIRAEYLAELPVRLHVAYVPGRPEPITVGEYSAASAGYVGATVSVGMLDTGSLGSPSWSPPMHARVGAVTSWAGVAAIDQRDYRLFPWAQQLEGLRRWCSRTHQAWYEHRGRPLCWILARHLVLGGYGVAAAATLEEVSAEKARELLLGAHQIPCQLLHRGRCPAGALDRWWTWVSNELNELGTTRRRLALTSPEEAA